MKTYYTFPGTRPQPLKKSLAKARSPFSTSEYAKRLTAFRSKLNEMNLYASIVTEGGNIRYLSGFAAESGYVAQAVLVYADDRAPQLVLRKQDTPAGMYLSHFPNEQVVDYPEYLVGNPKVSGFDFMVDLLDVDGRAKAVGMEFDAISAVTLLHLRSTYSGISFQDVSGVLMKQRLIKSSAELDYQRQAAEITDVVMRKTKTMFRVGRRENDIAAEITAGLIAGTDTYPGDVPDTVLMPGGALTGTSHIPWTDEPIQIGRHYNLEFGASRFGYCVGLMRTVCVGAPSQKLARLYEYIREGCDEALNLVRDGVSCGKVAQKYCAILDKGGYWKDSRCGYPIGINWLEDSCSLSVDDPTVMKTGMVFHLMLGTWLEDDFGAVLSETFIVQPDGCEVLSKIPRELIIAGDI